MGGHGIGQLGRGADFADALHQFLGDALVQFGIPAKVFQHRPAQGFGLDGVHLRLGHGSEFDVEEIIHLKKLQDASPAFTLHQGFDRAVRQFQQLQDFTDRTHLVDIRFLRRIDTGMLLGGKKHPFVTAHGVGQGVDGFGAAHEKRCHHVGKNHDVTQRQKRELKVFPRRIVFKNSGNRYHNFSLPDDRV